MITEGKSEMQEGIVGQDYGKLWGNVNKYHLYKATLVSKFVILNTRYN